jgi:hypothetical protein
MQKLNLFIYLFCPRLCGQTHKSMRTQVASAWMGILFIYLFIFRVRADALTGPYRWEKKIIFYFLFFI